MKTIFKHSLLAAAALTCAFSSQQVSAHCQIPCGIYSDDTVFRDLETHQATILKSMQEIEKLSADPSKNANQLARWVHNKEEHAQAIQDVVAKYFLAQRVKTSEAESDQAAYVKKLTLLHKITVLSMKCKQTTDLENAKQLLTNIKDFETAYKK